MIIAGTHNLTIDPKERLDLEARGGNGIDGHVGANGRNGNSGRKGYDASRTYPGEDGHDGENGGPGSPGTNGTKAGSGGAIDVFVDENDLALLPIIRTWDVSAGVPGRAGRHGQGGAGGPGGEGGASCHWEEQESYQEWEYYWPPRIQRQVLHGHPTQNIHYHNVHNHREDSHHHVHTDPVQYEWYQPPQEQRLVTKTRTVHKYNSGGRPGRTGLSGFTPTTLLYPGEQGQAGHFKIHVTHNGTVIGSNALSYGLTLATTSSNGVDYCEPGETIQLSYAARNIGKTMPTPIESMPLEVEPSASFACTQTSNITGSIQPNQTHEADHPIDITLPVVTHDSVTPYYANVPVTTKLMNTRLGNAFTTNTQHLTVQYPTQLTLSQTAASVRNRSQKQLGKEANRALSITVKDANGTVIQTQDIENLNAQSTHDIHFRALALGAAVWFDRPTKYSFDLSLEPIDRSQEKVLIQRQATTIHSLFKLPIQVLAVDNPSQSSVFEPGEDVLITYGVDNSANEVDYPGTKPLSIQVADSSSFTCKQTSQITERILAKKTQRANQQTILKIAPVTHTQSGIYQQQIPIKATLGCSSYEGKLSQTEYTLSVQYPVQMEVPQEEYALLKDESLPLQMSLNNISNNVLGTKTKRAVQVNVTDEQHNVLYSFPITSLTPDTNGQAVDTRTMQLKFADQAWLGEQSRYFIDLLLQPSDTSLPMRVIQRKPISMRLVTAYEPTHSGAFTLVFNKSTASEVQRAWYQFLSQLSGEKNIAIYDTSHYQEFPIDRLLADNKKGSIVMLPGEQKPYAVTSKQMLDAYQKHQTGVIAVGENAHDALAGYTSNTTTLDVEEDDASANHTYDDLIKTLLATKENEVSHQLRIKLDYFFASKNKPEYHVQKVQEILSQTFPNRSYHVSSKRTEDNTAVLSVRRLADPTHESVKSVSSQTINPETEQAFINALPFSQKLRFFTSPTNPYRESLATSIREDLQKEQQRLSKTQGYGSWWQRVTNQFDQSHVDMRHLKELVSCLKAYHNNADFTNFNAWSPLVISMIAEVKKQVEQSIGFWDKFFHIFTPQAKINCAKSSVALCDEVLREVRTLSAS